MKIKVAQANHDKHEKKLDVMKSVHKRISDLRKSICYHQKSLAVYEKCPSTTENVRIARSKNFILKQKTELAKLTGPKVGNRFKSVEESGKVVQRTFTKKKEAMKLQIDDVASRVKSLEDDSEANEERITEVLSKLESITNSQAEIDSLFSKISLLEDRVTEIEEEFTQRLQEIAHEFDAFKGEVAAEVEAVALKAEATDRKAEATDRKAEAIDRKAEATDRKAEANSATLELLMCRLDEQARVYAEQVKRIDEQARVNAEQAERIAELEREKTERVEKPMTEILMDTVVNKTKRAIISKLGRGGRALDTITNNDKENLE
ncbi:hypothetical protein TrCOL_g4592 [Triparma columacea]|uniref:Uncharacterized protein n=1 Tax=Triparma columacea TaxID=722753 RepID=A0A9W7GEX3_9STRA|nr:hypothetical protein TrCOL_g4592 [Triparma columacea]